MHFPYLLPITHIAENVFKMQFFGVLHARPARLLAFPSHITLYFPWDNLGEIIHLEPSLSFILPSALKQPVSPILARWLLKRSKAII